MDTQWNSLVQSSVRRVGLNTGGICSRIKVSRAVQAKVVLSRHVDVFATVLVATRTQPAGLNAPKLLQEFTVGKSAASESTTL